MKILQQVFLAKNPLCLAQPPLSHLSVTHENHKYPLSELEQNFSFTLTKDYVQNNLLYSNLLRMLGFFNVDWNDYDRVEFSEHPIIGVNLTPEIQHPSEEAAPPLSVGVTTAHIKLEKGLTNNLLMFVIGFFNDYVQVNSSLVASTSFIAGTF